MPKVKTVCRWGQQEHIVETEVDQEEFDALMALDEDKRIETIHEEYTQDEINNSGFEAYSVLLGDGEEEE